MLTVCRGINEGRSGNGNAGVSDSRQQRHTPEAVLRIHRALGFVLKTQTEERASALNSCGSEEVSSVPLTSGAKCASALKLVLWLSTHLEVAGGGRKWRKFLRHYELAHLLSNIEKSPLPIWGSMLPFWNPTGVFPRSVTPTRRKGHPLVVCCFLSIQRPSGVNLNEGEATPGPDLARVHSGRSGPRW